jgi:hypothetical protein
VEGGASLEEVSHLGHGLLVTSLCLLAALK